MIKFTLRDLKDRGYTVHLQGNGGEEELVIMTSWGQDMKSSLVITKASVDGHCEVLYSSKRIAPNEVMRQLEKHLNKWWHGGIKPTAAEEKLMILNQKKVIDELCDKWSVPVMNQMVSRRIARLAHPRGQAAG